MPAWHTSALKGSKAAARLLVALGLAATACASEEGAPVDTRTAAINAPDVTGTGSGKLDVLFMIDNSSGMAPMQQKLVAEVPAIMQTLTNLPAGPPDMHVAVVSSDMGAPGDSVGKIGCTPTGDYGVFQTRPRGACTGSTLTPGATFISSAPGDSNYTAANLSDVLACILPLGDGGCQFVHPLAAIAHALGADGTPMPDGNVGFLRPDAMLAIIILTHQDDCSASSPITALYSLNNGPDNLINSFGPLTTYRCNEFGHLCLDPRGDKPDAFVPPPESTLKDVQGTPSAPTLDLVQCQSNETGGLLTSVTTFVDDIRALKADPDHQIVVSAIVAPPSPYTVAWVPMSDVQDAAGQLLPQVEHSCGAANGDDVNSEATELPTDGSFGDPGVRLTQFVQAFGENGVTASVCDASYASIVGPLVALIGENAPVAGVTGTAGADGGDGGVVGGGSGVSGRGGSSGSLAGLGAASGHGATGLHAGCSVAAPAPAGSGVAVLLVALAALRRRAKRPAKT
jgi:hypothetical protein